ncbi:MAG: hypothetical protein KF914_09740 [Rhizobiaceae bacterium]|nr:hypothetical protein [Rhizobiaceae bacterium]
MSNTTDKGYRSEIAGAIYEMMSDAHDAGTVSHATLRWTRLVRQFGGLAKVKLWGRRKVDAAFTFTVIAYNLIRLPKLIAGQPA